MGIKEEVSENGQCRSAEDRRRSIRSDQQMLQNHETSGQVIKPYNEHVIKP